MASCSSTTLSISSSSIAGDSRALPRQSSVAASPQCVSLPPLPPPLVQSQNRTAAKATAYCRKMIRNVAVRATGEAPVEAVTTTEVPDVVKTIQETWEKVEDKYAVSSLVIAGAVAFYASIGMIGAIDRLPLVPGVLELIGIGYTGWFAYKNIIFKPEREALVLKIKNTYKDIIGSS